MASLLIIGAKSDIARALARKYAGHGYDLCLAGRNMEVLEPFARDLRIRSNRTVILKELDLRAFSSHPIFYQGLEEKPLGVVLCAGYLTNQERTQNFWEESLNTIEVNYTGCVSILNVIAEDFEKQQEGFIIGISSVAGDRGRKSNYTYGSAKAGFTAYLSGLRNRLWESNVQVITVKPGFVHTRMTRGMALPEILTARPEQVAEAVFRAHQKGRSTIYTLWIWRYIMLIIGHLPEFIFKRMKL